MTFAAEKILVGRKPVTFVELDLDLCTRTYGVSPCTAAIGVTGTDKCFNTRKSCQDTPNYLATTKTYRFVESIDGVPVSVDATPSLISVDVAPTKLEPSSSTLGHRASVTVTLQDHSHHDRGVDPYVTDRSYDPAAQGTFWPRFIQRNAFYQGRILRVRSGYLTDPFDWANFEDRTYVIDRIEGPDKNGKVKIVAKDILKLADDDRAIMPKAVTASLSANLLAATTTSFSVNTGEGANVNPQLYTNEAAFDNAYWIKAQTGDSVTANATKGPMFDTTTADKFIPGTEVSVEHWIRKQITGITLGDIYMVSIFCKPAGYNRVRLRLDFPTPIWVNLNMSTGVWDVNYDGSGALPTRKAYVDEWLDGWWRITVIAPETDTNTGLILNVLDESTGNPLMTGDGTSGVHLWGAMCAKISDISRMRFSTEYVRINDEILYYGGRSGDTFSTLTRGMFGTTARDHSAGDAVQPVQTVWPMNVVVAIYEMLRYGANIPAAYFPITDWQTEKDNWLSPFILHGVISEPLGVKTMLSELSEQCLLNLWWDEKTSTIKLKAVAPPASGAGSLTRIDDDMNLIDSSVVVQDDPKQRVSELLIYYDQKDYTSTDLENYQRLYLKVDTAAESSDEYGETRVRTIKSRWFDENNAGQVVQLAGRLFAGLRDNPKVAKFALDAKDSALWTGDQFDIETRHIQDFDGSDKITRMRVLQVDERIPGSRYEYVAQSSEFLFGDRNAFIGADTLPDYPSATPTQKASWGWIAPDSGLFSNGDNAYGII